MAYVFDYAGSLGMKRVIGEYIPTAKNAMVREFFAQFGFRQLSAEADGRTRWALNLGEFNSAATYIRQTEKGNSVAVGS
jgi:predicted enzyme involved in methoxymalonyl-ACP biosynthesis